MSISVFTENRAQICGCHEAQKMVLYLHDSKKWPLPVEEAQFVADLSGEPRRLVGIVIDSHKDPEFAVVAAAMEQAVINVEAGLAADEMED